MWCIILRCGVESEKAVPGQKRYLTIKYGFAQQNIPVQFVQYGTVTSPYALKSSIPNFDTINITSFNIIIASHLNTCGGSCIIS